MLHRSSPRPSAHKFRYRFCRCESQRSNTSMAATLSLSGPINTSPGVERELQRLMPRKFSRARLAGNRRDPDKNCLLAIDSQDCRNKTVVTRTVVTGLMIRNPVRRGRNGKPACDVQDTERCSGIRQVLFREAYPDRQEDPGLAGIWRDEGAGHDAGRPVGLSFDRDARIR